MTLPVDMTTYYKRVANWGYTHEEAALCPRRLPLWIYRIEQEEGRPLQEILREAADSAHITGYSLSDLAREWGVTRTTLYHWANKWAIRFPRGTSSLLREKARQNIARANQRRVA